MANNDNIEDRTRTVKLFCPSLSKLVQFAACEDQKLDFGSIAREFGLNPLTVKLNGHFISRGIDLKSTSVTWRSLLSFFSAKGFSVGENDNDPLLVDGKFGKKSQPNKGHGFKRKFLFEDLSLLKKLKINDYDPDIQRSERSNHGNNIVRNPCTCSHSSEKVKRTREDDVIVAAPCKRIK